jgi:DNA-binding MarR family transcriptional regulator
MNQTDPTAYGDSLAFLLSQIGSRSGELFAERLRPIGISPREFAVLSHVASGYRTQQELADLLGIHRNNMVSLIDAMEVKGWVGRHRSDSDRRAFEIRPTAAGLKVVAAVNDEVPRLDGAIGECLSASERSDLVGLLMRIADSLRLAAAVHPSVAGRRSS